MLDALQMEFVKPENIFRFQPTTLEPRATMYFKKYVHLELIKRKGPWMGRNLTFLSLRSQGA